MRRKMHQPRGIRIFLHIHVPETNLRLLLFLLVEDRHLSAAVGHLFGDEIGSKVARDGPTLYQHHR